MRDFDDMMKQYQEDPDAFEEEAREAIQDFIDHLPNDDCRLRAQQMQFRIDRELRPYTDPVARMNKMVELFWEGFQEFQHVLNACAAGEPNPVPVSARENPSADVIEFKPRSE